MNTWGVLQQLQQNGVGYYRAIAGAARQHGISGAAKQAGMSCKSIRHALWVWDRFSRKRHQKHALSVEAMSVVAHSMNAIKSNHPAWVATMDACIHAAAGKTVDEVKAACTKIIADTLTAEASAHRRVETLGIQREADAHGQRLLNLKLSDVNMAALEQVLSPAIQKIRKKHPQLTHAQAGAQALLNAVLSGDGEVTPQRTAHPYFLLALGEEYTYRNGVITDRGAQMSWAEAANYQLAPYGYALVIARDEDGVPQARRVAVQRFADDAIRDINALELLRCAWEDCNKPARGCQSHHIEAWSRGGETTAENTTALCAPHNGQNDDNPDRHLHGRIERCHVTGTPGLRRRPGEPLRFNTAHVVQYGWRAFAARAYNL